MLHSVCMLGRVVLLVLVVLVGGSLTSMAQDCGDVNGDGETNQLDIAAFTEYFRTGAPVVADSANLELDHRAGLTVGDLAAAVDCIILFGLWDCSCGTDSVYSYSPAARDTIFFPYYMDIVPGVDTVYLPVMARTYAHWDHQGYAINLPYLPIGAGSDAVFAPVEANYRSGDTALILYVPEWGLPGGRHDIDTLCYARVQAGIGSVAPEVVDSWDGKQMAVATTTADQYPDLAVPTVVYYNANNCCKGRVGDVNGDGVCDISDLMALVNPIFIHIVPDPFPCPAEANINGDAEGNIDISDVGLLVNHLFITFEELPYCPL